MTLRDEREAEVGRFVARVFGLRGSLRLHRVALGFDLLKAPLNVVLAPVFLLVRLLAALFRRLGMLRLAGWLARRRVLFETAVARRVAQDVSGLLDRLASQGLLDAQPEARARAVQDYVGVRSAVAEMVTSLFVLLAGVILFHAATPGVISLAGPLAELRVRGDAIAAFPLGSGLGRLYYGVFPVALPVWQVVTTGLVLAVLGALVTTFAGVLADPVQVATGTHRRRLMRMIDRLQANSPDGIAKEHLMARVGDLSDMALSVWRVLKG